MYTVCNNLGKFFLGFHCRIKEGQAYSYIFVEDPVCLFLFKLILFIVPGCLLNLMHTSSNATDHQEKCLSKLWECEVVFVSYVHIFPIHVGECHL